MVVSTHSVAGPMSDILLLWSFPLAVAAHNLEEAIWLPRWSVEHAGRWHRPVSAGAFRFAVSVLTALVFVIAGWAQVGGVGSVGHYLLAAYAVAQALNVAFPHAVATIATRTYAPGLLSGLFLVLPAAIVLVVRSLAEAQLEPGRFVAVSVGFILSVVASIPLLFGIGTRLEAAVIRRKDGRQTSPSEDPRRASGA
jgi:hypothetical protein